MKKHTAYKIGAIELDPEFAEAYAGRAIGLGVGAQWANDQDTELDRAQHDIDTALENHLWVSRTT